MIEIDINNLKQIYLININFQPIKNDIFWLTPYCLALNEWVYCMQLINRKVMKKKILVLFLSSLASMSSFAQGTISIGNTDITVDTLFTGAGSTWEMVWGSDDHLWITEKQGLVSRINPISKQRNVVLDISDDIFDQGEAGLLGMALHPDFQNSPEVFLVYTYGTSGNIRERLVKYQYTANALINPVTLIDNIPGYTSHDGSRLLFLNDGTLLMSTGDAQDTDLPQDLNSLSGKILRVKTDGSVPPDNPFPNNRVYSYGHRNPQGLCMMPDGSIYMTEHGPSNDDEFQALEAGANYGWPNVEGFCNTPSEMAFCADHNVKEPIVAWTPTIAPSGMVYYENPAFPEFDGRFLIAVLKDMKIRTLKLNASGDTLQSQDDYLVNIYGRLRDLCVGPNGEIYIATNNNTNASIIVLRPSSSLGLADIHYPNILIYPKKVNDIVTIDMGDTVFKALDIKIVNTAGQIIDQRQLTLKYTEMDVSMLAMGFYSLIIEKDREVIFQTEIIK